MNFKGLFKRSLGADRERLHFAAHSHHLWPDASLDGQIEAWDDGARLADRKWGRVMDELWPAAQSEVASELGTGANDAIVFASNTHDLLVRLLSAVPTNGPIRILTSDGEFHSARRQFARFEEIGDVIVERVTIAPFDSFTDRFMKAARARAHDVIFVSQVMFASGQLFSAANELAALGQANGPWVVIDGYHAFMAIDQPFGAEAGKRAFYLAGGYKYAMAGEGCAFMHAPPGFGPCPRITGWFAEFEDLSLPSGRVGYAKDASRFLGATFDPSALYRFVAVRRMLASNGLTTRAVAAHCLALQERFLSAIGTTPLADAELLNPLTAGQHARFLAFSSPSAQRWNAALMKSNCITDVRGDVLRIGFGLYQDDTDVDRLIALVGGLR